MIMIDFMSVLFGMAAPGNMQIIRVIGVGAVVARGNGRTAPAADGCPSKNIFG